ncbi:hypothetical protein G97194_004744 [Escherichia coli]|nr:hypothetical protein G97194_004744 [Escherichia coli]
MTLKNQIQSHIPDTSHRDRKNQQKEARNANKKTGLGKEDNQDKDYRVMKTPDTKKERLEQTTTKKKNK